jgi:hypothetical protein
VGTFEADENAAALLWADVTCGKLQTTRTATTVKRTAILFNFM